MDFKRWMIGAPRRKTSSKRIIFSFGNSCPKKIGIDKQEEPIKSKHYRLDSKKNTSGFLNFNSEVSTKPSSGTGGSRVKLRNRSIDLLQELRNKKEEKQKLDPRVLLFPKSQVSIFHPKRNWSVKDD